MTTSPATTCPTYSANFTTCLALTLKWEGGFCDNPKDPGGATNFGITEATLSACRVHVTSRAAVKNLTKDEAAQIYWTHYWQPINGDSLPLGVAMVAFDIAVNMGIGRARQWLAATVSKAHDARARILALDAKRRTFWQRLRSFATFGRGWLRREDDVVKVALGAK